MFLSLASGLRLQVAGDKTTIDLSLFNVYNSLQLFHQKEKTMLTLEELRKSLQGKNLFAISRETEVAYNTIRDIANGKQVNPTYKTMKAITDHLGSK